MSIEANILDSNTTFNVNDIQELYNNAIWEMSQDIEINGSYWTYNRGSNIYNNFGTGKFCSGGICN